MECAEDPPALTMSVGLAAGIVATAPAVLIAVVSAGAGHGGYVAARLLFPPAAATMVAGPARGGVGGPRPGRPGLLLGPGPE